jgi:starvation-inducible outer membrane lipoprotein
MKFFAYLLCFYLFALTALPSVRAIKMQFSEKCQSTCQKMNSDTAYVKMNVRLSGGNHLLTNFSSKNFNDLPSKEKKKKGFLVRR